MNNKVLIIIVLASVFACSQKEDVVVLQQGTPAYELGLALSEKIPGLNPDSNKILVKTDFFDVSTGEVIQLLQSTHSTRVLQLKTMPPEQVTQIVEQNAERLAEQKLFLRAAEKFGINIPEMKIDSVLQNNYTRAGGEEQFRKYLETNGISMDYVRESIITSLSIQRYIEQAVLSEIEITETEVEESFAKMDQGNEKASVRHILLMTQGKNNQEKKQIRKKMEDILKRARGGEDFAELARTYTEDPGSKDKGGLYENFARGTMVKPFEEAAFSLPVGQISDIVETQYGYHILKIVDRSKESKSLQELRPQIEKNIIKQKQPQIVQTHLDELKSTANFEKYAL